jgi:nucleoside-diphosphate-sugar epimerase
MSEPRRAFVTGASGFVGRHLVERLLSEGWAVKAMDLRHDRPSQARLTTIKGDITDRPLLEKELEGVDIVFHLAAALGASLIGEAEFFHINAGGTAAVLEAAEKRSVKRIVHFSSAGVLGAVDPGEVAGEDYPRRPIDVYDKSKYEGERIALKHADRPAGTSGPDIVIIRPGWLYGPGDRRTLKLIKAIVNKRFVLVTKGEALQTPCYIDDLIAGTLLCAAQGKNGEIYHIAGPQVLTVKDICETIASAGGTKIPGLRLPLWPVRIAAWKLGLLYRLFGKEAPLTMGKLAFFIHPKPLDIGKARRELGYAPQTDFESGLTRTIAWLRAHSWL